MPTIANRLSLLRDSPSSVRRQIEGHALYATPSDLGIGSLDIQPTSKRLPADQRNSLGGRKRCLRRQSSEPLRTLLGSYAAAAFTFDREDLIPTMFRNIVRDLGRGFEGLAVFEYYLERHIEVDDESHGPVALSMLEDLCGQDDKRWAEATRAANSAFAARLRMWDAILDRIVHSRDQTDFSPAFPKLHR
jgi:Protein of unknown function (DUF3050)